MSRINNLGGVTLMELVGEARWRIPIGRDVWDELRKPERYDESSWDGKRFQSIYGVPARMFDELVAEAAKHPTLCKKVTWGDGVKGPLPKPLHNCSHTPPPPNPPLRALSTAHT